MNYPPPDVVYSQIRIVEDEHGKKVAVFTDHGTKVTVIAYNGEPALCFDKYVVPVPYYFGSVPADAKHPGMPDIDQCTTAVAEKIGKVYERRVDTFIEERDRAGGQGSYTILDKIKKDIAQEKNFRRVAVENYISVYRMGAPGRHDALQSKELRAVLMNKLRKTEGFEYEAVTKRITAFNFAQQGAVKVTQADVAGEYPVYPTKCAITGEELNYNARENGATGHRNLCVDIITHPSLDERKADTEHTLNVLARGIADAQYRLGLSGRDSVVGAVVQGKVSAVRAVAAANAISVRGRVAEVFRISNDPTLSPAQKQAAIDALIDERDREEPDHVKKQRIHQQAKADASVYGVKRREKDERGLEAMRVQERLMKQRLQGIEAERVSPFPWTDKKILLVCDYVARLTNMVVQVNKEMTTRLLGQRTYPRSKKEGKLKDVDWYPSVEKLVDYVVRIGTPEQVKRLYESLQKAARAEGYPVEKAFPCVKPTLQEMYHAQDI